MPNLRRLSLLFLLVALTLCAGAQTLARKGWAGSGLNSDPWWKHAVVYRLDPKHFSADGLRGVSSRLSYIQSLGADAILLDGVAVNSSGNLDPALGTMDDLDDLIRQFSSRSIRVLLRLDPKTADQASTARLWLAHGIAGFYAPEATPDQIAEIQKTLNSFAGQRILIGNLDLAAVPAASPEPITPAADSKTPSRRRASRRRASRIHTAPPASKPANKTAGPQLLADPRPGTVTQLTADDVRPALEASQETLRSTVSLLLISGGPAYKRSFSRYANGSHDVDIAKTLAAILLTTRSGALLYSGQELGIPAASPQDDAPKDTSAALQDADPASLLNWYRQLSAMHHTNRTLASADEIILNHDDQNVLAWVRKPGAVSPETPAIVVVCNLSDKPVTLSLKQDMQRLGLRGSFLRAILRSDNAMGAMHLDGMTLAPYMVYIGELRF